MENLKVLSKHPTSILDVERMSGISKVITYDKLKHYKSIDELLGLENAVIILYLTRENYGHWISVIRRSDGVLEFFDPYGIFVDDQLDWIKDKNFMIQKNMDVPYLLNLFAKSGENIEYNHYKFQKHGGQIATCGRHASIRTRFKNLSLNQYSLFIKNLGNLFNIKDKDILITLISEIYNE